MNGENKPPTWNAGKLPYLLAGGLGCFRMISLLGMSLDSLRGYGDFATFYQISGLPGWPFIHYWVEYPPVFPFLSALLHRLSGSHQHIFDYWLYFILLAADMGSVYLFTRLAQRLHRSESGLLRAVIYLLVLLTLAYSWWNFDALVVFWLLLGLNGLLQGKIGRAGAALSVGVATKFFPALALVAAWRRRTAREIAVLAVITLAPLLAGYGLLWQLSPEFTSASIMAQGSKGSWETVWAVLDGNIRTGSFGPLSDRLEPAKAFHSAGRPAVIPSAVSLVIFGGLGLAGLLTTHPRDDRQSLGLVGFAFCLLFLWSPGWSPQWCLYLVPLILLVLPERLALLLAGGLIMVNLLEWPVMLSRGFFELLWAPVLLRTLLIGMAAGLFWSEARGMRASEGQA